MAIVASKLINSNTIALSIIYFCLYLINNCDSCIDWTEYYNTREPSGSGEFEITSTINRGLLILGTGGICGGEEPTAIECRSAEDDTIYDANDDYWDGIGIPESDRQCDVDRGFICIGSACPDFKVRYCCPGSTVTNTEPSCSGTWEGWINGDDASDGNDFETVRNIGTNNICGGQSAENIQCQSVEDGINYDDYVYDSNNYRTQCSTGSGYYCAHGGDGNCPDFKVRFCCSN